jgi:hypothetical protein
MAIKKRVVFDQSSTSLFFSRKALLHAVSLVRQTIAMDTSVINLTRQAQSASGKQNSDD